MGRPSFYLSVVILIAFQRGCHGFVSRSVLQNSLSSTVLFYTDDPPKQESPVRKHRFLTMPVLRLPGSKPLLVGEDFVLDDPTPLQWQVLEESMYNHREYIKEQAQMTNDNDLTSTAGIAAAPLVAFMDDVTSLAPVPADKRNGKYATIAAVVGISSSEKNSKPRGDLDTSSTTSFMESLMCVFKPDFKIPTNSKIRLVGIGRAALSDFYSRMPSTHYESTRDSYLEVDNDNNDSSYNQGQTPVMMAQFRLLSDTGERSAHFTRYGRSSNSSPVHALNEMSNFANRITSLHEDRKRLVRGLKAAKARLAVASTGSNDDDDVLEDHDGLGQLSSGFTADQQARVETQQDIQTLLNDFPGDTSISHPHSAYGSSKNAHAAVLAMENYGLGISSSSFSQIPGLTKALDDKLQPYYSPEKRASEEHYYEVFSFMSVLSLSKFVPPEELDWTLKCTNTIERMEWVYDKMWMHKRLLKKASEEVSAELRDCGEECTDLW